MPIWMLAIGCLSKKNPMNEHITDSSITEDTAEVDVDTNGSPHQSQTYTIGSDTVVVDVVNNDGLRQYTMTTTHPLRDGYQQSRVFSEDAEDPRLRSGELLTDALFAMAVFEAKENSVSEISDGAFSETVACDCYQTGELGMDTRYRLCGRSRFKAFGRRTQLEFVVVQNCRTKNWWWS
jgi:hypothetical protein